MCLGVAVSVLLSSRLPVRLTDVTALPGVTKIRVPSEKVRLQTTKFASGG